MVEYPRHFRKAFCNCNFLKRCRINTLRLRTQCLVHAANPGESSSTTEPYLEASICKATHQAFYGSDRTTICQDPWNPPANSEIFFDIEQRVRQLSHGCRDSC